MSAAEVEARDLRLGLAGTGIAVTMWGLSGVVIKWIDMDALAVGFWRFFVYALVMWGWLAARGGVPSRRVLRASMWGGLSLGVDIVFFFSAVRSPLAPNYRTQKSRMS